MKAAFLAIAIFLFLLWWEGSEKRLQIPEKAYKEMPYCMQLETLDKKSELTMEEFEYRGQVAAECGNEQENYMAIHGTWFNFFTPPYVIEKWFED